jgi:hypothetical protein
MFDNLREEASFYEEDQAQFQPAAGTEALHAPEARRSRRFLGMTSMQRFVIAFMLMIAVCVIGALCLLVTGKIAF